MRKMTPMILVILMLASVLSSIDVYELQEQNEFEETSARSNADPEVVMISSPRETTTLANGDTIHELLAGEPVNFKAYIKNSGDADLTRLTYSATIYADNAGERGAVIQDSNGNDLIWSNDGAICPQGCDYVSLAAGEFLGGGNGETTLSANGGNAFEWTPTPGKYWVEVEVQTTQPGNDVGNDVYVIQVTARPYYDIVIDVAWLDSNGNPISESSVDGTDDVSFKVYADLVTSNLNDNVRDLNVSISIGGDYESSDAPSYVALGSLTTVEVESDVLGQTAPTVGDRMIVGNDGNSFVRGESPTYTITPSADGTFSVDVAIYEYYLYEADSSCGANRICEVRYTDSDEYRGNNLDSIVGSSSTVHSIALLDYTIMLGEDGNYEEDMTTYGFVGGSVTETLSPGVKLLTAYVVHDATSQSPIYDWNLTFSITNMETNTLEHVLDTNSCTELDYDYDYLGFATDRYDAEPEGIACSEFNFGEGSWHVEARLNMLGEVENARQVDQLLSDNSYAFTFDVENFAPQILSVTTSSSDDLVADESRVQTVRVSVESFDVEDEQTDLDFNWRTVDGDRINCENGGSSDYCDITITEEMVPLYRGTVTVEDSMGKSDLAAFDFRVMNRDTISTSEGDLSAGYAAVYDIIYSSTGLTVTFADGSSGDSISIDGCIGTYTVTSSIVITPSTSYDSTDLLGQSLTVHFPSDAGITSAWLQFGQQMVQIGAGEGNEITGATRGYTFNLPSGTDMITPGTEVLFISEECVVPAAPTGAVTGLSATASTAGSITISWAVEDMLSTETLHVTVCETSSGCETPVAEYMPNPEVTTSTLLSGQGNTVHNTTYVVEAKICNDHTCTTPLTDSAVADSEVAAVTATSVTITETATMWDVDWEASFVDADIASWLVCYERGNGFDAQEASLMAEEGDCFPASDTMLSLEKPDLVGTYTYHFAILPVDVVGNVGSSASTDSIELANEQDLTNPGDGSTTTDSETSSGVPTWTWGVIGAVVVVAFIVGAFILSRGEGDDDDKEWDY